MTIADMIDGLKQSGTGERKLDAIRSWAEQNPKKDAQDAIAHFSVLLGSSLNGMVPRGGVPLATIEKMKHLCDGKPLADLLGKPPKSQQEERDVRLLDGVAERFAASLAAKMPTQAVNQKPASLSSK